MLRNPVAALIVAFFFIALPPFCGLRLRLRAIALALRAAIWLRTLLYRLRRQSFRKQLSLKSPGSQKLPRYATPPPSISHEKLALITLGTLLNTISQSEFDEGVAPALTSVAYEIGQRCRRERIFDCFRNREVDIAQELRSRNRSRHASRRAEDGLLPVLQERDARRESIRSTTSASDRRRQHAVRRGGHPGRRQAAMKAK